MCAHGMLTQRASPCDTRARVAGYHKHMLSCCARRGRGRQVLARTGTTTEPLHLRGVVPTQNLLFLLR